MGEVGIHFFNCGEPAGRQTGSLLVFFDRQRKMTDISVVFTVFISK